MTDQTAIPELPDGFSLYDWLELLGFIWKIENEGYEYASENYAPEFESEQLRAIAEDDDPRPLKKLYRDHQQALETWQEAVGWEAASDLWDAHQREEQERKEAHLLWAIHPGGDWNYYAYSQAFATREEAQAYIDQSHELAEKNPRNFRRCDWRILHRSEPGGAWSDAPAVVAAAE